MPHTPLIAFLALAIPFSAIAQVDEPAPRALPVTSDDAPVPKALPLEEFDGEEEERPAPKPIPMEDEEEKVPRALPVLPGDPDAVRPEDQVPAPRAIPFEEEPEQKLGSLDDWNGGDTDPDKPAKPDEKQAAPKPDEPDFEPPPLPTVNKREYAGEAKSAPIIGASWETRTEARTLTLKVPAPRGQINDRYGQPLAQNKVGYYMALKFPHLADATERDVLNYANERINASARYLGKEWSLSRDIILAHYKNRRWLPLPFSPMLSSHQNEIMEDRLGPGIELFPTYQRYYPERSTACHILGYVGKQTGRELGEVVSGEPMWPTTEGREGLELTFDQNLQGVAGSVNYLFDTNGKKLSEDIVKAPLPGNNVITTIDLEMQQLAEKSLRDYTRKGAFVVMDVQTGDIYAMASLPTYDINKWIPGISPEEFRALQEDLDKPMFPRAYRGQYPPASTFKPAVALAALESGVVDGETLIDCPSSWSLGNETFRNWNKDGEGRMNVAAALKRSCNTWFYEVGLRTGAENISSMAHRFGFGTQTGLPLNAEEDGFMPTEANIQENYKHAFSHGYLAQASIGQWRVSATPLQVAQMMAGIGNGYAVPNPRLVMQVQDLNGNIVESFEPQERNALNVNPKNLGYIRQGLVDVVNASSGTGKAASNYYVTMAGKTGTGQWNQKEGKLYLSWFAGYIPAENPKYAFAAVCEGNPGEYISGSKKAAPLVGAFFNDVYKRKKARGELGGYARTATPTGASSSVASSGSQPSDAPEASAADQGTPVTEAPPRRRGLFGGFGKRRNR